MTGENVPPDQQMHEAPDRDARRRTPRFDSNALIQGLERLRECIDQRLERLESLARERTAATSAAAEPSELQRELQRRIAELEEERRRLRVYAERREQEWEAALEQLEADRKLLAEAWDRLDHERIEALAAAQGPADGRSAAADRTALPTARPLPERADPAGDDVAHAILEQFQALRNDVRRNARQRGHV